MATIHSLPFEVTRHLLALAYPAGQPGSCAGLRATALVHSSWTGPAKSVLLEQVALSGKSDGSAQRFIATGPVGFSCQSLTVDSCTTGQLRAVLAKANPGGVRRLAISRQREPVSCDLFETAALSGK